jgi:hypothetical protein
VSLFTESDTQVLPSAVKSRISVMTTPHNAYETWVFCSYFWSGLVRCSVMCGF